MKPIIVIVVIAIAITGIGVGSLGNTINLSVQQIGVGDEFLDSPISAATIDFVIARASGTDGSDTTQTHSLIRESALVHSLETFLMKNRV